APSGDIGDLGSGAETRKKYQVVNLGVGKALTGRDQALFNSFQLDPIAVQPTSVVDDFNHHLASLIVRFQQHSGNRRFTARDAFAWRFDAVIQGIPDHVHQRIAEFLNNTAVQFDVVALSLHFNLLAKLAR